MEKIISKNSFIAAIFFAIALRSIISLHDYSGCGKPPIFGDFEAQRHWQEITVNTPIQDWYKNSSRNDLQYWGLDYPPLTAYHSLLLGKLAQQLNGSYTELFKSRGITSDEHKNFMRTTVLLSDLLIYLPALTVLVKILRRKNENLKWFAIFLIALTYPGQILIDNGHFQYNNMSLGLTLLAICCMLLDKDVLAAILFSFALNYKQMELYHSIPFFIYLLRRCFPSPSINFHNFTKSFGNLIKIGLTVIFCFVILWSPWLTSMENFKSVVVRLFPFNRGVFEDKVANFWCIFNVIVKIKQIFSNDNMVKICLISTSLAILPSSINLFLQPKKKKFLYALLNSSLSFFLFSYQVHEKSILIAALPALVLFNDNSILHMWFLQISTFSMLPLLQKDGLTLAFICTGIIYEIIYQILNLNNNNSVLENLRKLSIFCTIAIAFGYFYGPIPINLPHIYDILIAGYCCTHFLLFLIYFNIKQWKI